MQNKPKIDETDANILASLLMESRTTFTTIAKDCKISIGAVKARYERLKRDGVVKGEIMQLDPRVIGYNIVVDLEIATAAEDEIKAIDFIKSKPYIARIGAGTFWKFNIRAFAVLKNIEILANIQEELEANPLIKEIRPLIWTEVTGMDHPENLQTNELRTTKKKIEQDLNKKQTSTSNTQMQMDETDRQIAKILTRNARMPFKRIAEQLDISTKSVIQRYRKLRGNLLTSSTITVDLKKLGYNALAHVLIKSVRKSEMPRIYEQILKIPNAIVTIRLIGPYDLRAIYALKDFDDAFTLNQTIREIKGIDQADIYLIAPFPEWPLNFFSSLLQQDLMPENPPLRLQKPVVT